MLSNNQTEGNPQDTTGAAEQPTSPASASGSQPLPDYVLAMQKQIEDFSTLVKGIQKGTDKQIGQVRTDVKRILELGKQGLDESQIHRELWIDQQMGNQNAPVQQPVGNEQKDSGIDVNSVIASLQFQPNDPALAALRIKFGNDQNALVKAAADLRLSQLTTPNPSPATLPSLSSGTPLPTPPVVDVAALQQEQSLLMKEPTKNYKRLKEIKEELKKAG